MNAPAIAVLLTQAAAIAWLCLLGAFVGSLARPSVGPLAAVRVALWTGLGIGTIAILTVGLLLPTRGRAGTDGPTFTRAWWVAVPIAGLVLLAFVCAHLAFGPVANYDTGLYHLSAIRYAADYPTIHGLANLDPRLGTNVSAFGIAAFLENLAWASDGFRLLVGVFLLVLSTDLGLRLLDGRSTAWRRPGTYLLLAALAVAVPGLLQSPDYNITGSSPDTIALALTLAAGAYLVDALQSREHAWIAVALVSAALAASVRTQLWVMFAATVIVLLVDALVRRRSVPSTGPRALTVIGAAVAVLVGLVMMVRDAVLSGWLFFPITALPVPVDWRVPQATADSTREWVMSWARDQAAGPEQTLTSYYWLPDWFRASAADWAVLGMVGLLSLALVVWLAARRTAPESRQPLVVLLALAPAVITVLVWFLTAPDPRFAWGPLLLVGAIPAAFALQRLAGSADIALSSVPVLAAGLLCVGLVPAAALQAVQIQGQPADAFEFRTYEFGPVDVVASVASLPQQTAREFTLVDGTVIQIPVKSDQCYEIFPLCTPYESTTLRLRGSEVSDGFRSD